jgi:glycerophosphoryl diester phosphodiesterase
MSTKSRWGKRIAYFAWMVGCWFAFSTLGNLTILAQDKVNGLLDEAAVPHRGGGVTAHRGNSGSYPENTLPAFASAIALGVDWMECDIFKTKDGKIVVIHDAGTGRMGDMNLLVAESTYEELLRVDVATEFRQKHGKSLAECPKGNIPLLEEVIRLTMTQRLTRLSIQPKMDIVDEAVALIRELKAESWIGFNEGSISRIRRVKELAPELPIFYDTDGKNTDLHVSRALKYGFESIVMNHRNVTAEDVEKIHAAKLEAGAWTVNDSKEMRRLLNAGIDRIYTDQAKTLMAIKEEIK